MQIPVALPANATTDEAFLRNLHTVLLDVRHSPPHTSLYRHVILTCGAQLVVKEGELICPNCNRSFPIKDGVPNLLLNEDEV